MTNKFYLFNNKWFLNDNIQQINTYLTYQKTLVDEKEIEKVLRDAEQILHPEIRHKINIFYKYQQTIRRLLS